MRARGWRRVGRWTDVAGDVDAVYSADWVRVGGMDVLAVGDGSDSLRLLQLTTVKPTATAAPAAAPAVADEAGGGSVSMRDTGSEAGEMKDTTEGSGTGTDRSDGDGDTVGFHTLTIVEDAHAGDVNCVRWRPEGTTASKGQRQIATAGDDGVIRVWLVALPASTS